MHLIPILAACIAVAEANHVLHERRDSPPPNWIRRKKLDSREVIPMKIALQQINMHKAEQYLFDVSHPSSKSYGQHWTRAQVAHAFKPRYVHEPDSFVVPYQTEYSDKTAATIRSWLIDSGIHPARIQQSSSMNWIYVNTTIREAEALLKTKYHIYEHDITGVPQVACHEYHIPQHVSEHVDFITPTVHFDQPLNVKHKVELSRRDAISFDPSKKRPRKIRRDSRTMNEAVGEVRAVGDFGRQRGQEGIASRIGTSLGTLPKQGVVLAAEEQILSDNIDRCDTRITPACLRALYGFGVPDESPQAANSYGIVEYSPQTYIQTDLDRYFSNFSTKAQGQVPMFKPINGGVLIPTNHSFDLNGESNLDLEIAMSVVAPMKITLYQVGDSFQGASFNNFLDAVDGNYCKFDGGDDPDEDASYPQSLEGYIGPQLCGGFPATKVISTSYGYNEADLTPAYTRRQCAEYLKLALQGVTMIFSSGDFGVAGNQGRCIDAATGNFTSTNSSEGVFNPTFPSSCPWVTSVGATELPRDTQISRDMAVNNTQPERVCETVIRSGGGFSNHFEMPEYQRIAVKRWFSDHPPRYGADRFNNSQLMRGYPDISLNGANYVITVNGNFTLTYGTSASAPVLGGIIALINEQRLKAGKTTVGFINPVLYDNPNILKDVTEGHNSGCGTSGFAAGEGWDPATGLGTPVYSRFLDAFMNLP